jgi:hypothetical protein
MSDSILRKYTGKGTDRIVDAVATEESETTDDLGAFGWLRGVRDRAVMLELRKKNGNVLAVGYAMLDPIEFDPSEGITLHSAGRKIRIKGRNLNAAVRPDVRLFQGITRHKVAWVQEADGPTALQAGKSATVIEKIEW